MTNYKPLNDYPDMLNAKQIAKILQIGYTKALGLVKYHLPHLKIGNTYRVHKGNFETWLEVNQSREFLLDK